MASKKRGGLSKREYAAAQKAKPKVSARKTVAKMTGIGPVANGQQYSDMVGASQGKFVGPYAPSFYDNAQKSNPNKATFKSPSKPSSKSNRQKVANSMLGVKTAEASDGIDYNQAELRPQTKASGLGRALQIAADPFGIRKKIRGATGMADFGRRPDFGITEALFGEGKDLRQDTGLADWTAPQGDKERVLGVEDSRYLNDLGNIRDTDPTVDANQYVGQRKEEAGRARDFAETGRMDITAYDRPYSTPSTQRGSNKSFEDRGASPMPDGWNDEASDYWTGQETAQESPVADLIAEMQPEMRTEEFPQDGSMQYPGGTTGNRSGRGNGAFGTGKGIQGDDPYLQEMRKSMKGYEGMEKDVRQQFEELIKALDPTYDQYRKEGETELNNQLNTDLTKLAAVMNANNTGDSEQRAQMMAGQQTTNRGLLANLLEKLAQQKNQDITGYKTKSIDAVNSIREKGMGARERIAQMMKQAQDDQWDRQYKMDSLNQRGSGGSSSAGSVTYIGNNAAGEPVYRNTKTGATMVGSGLKRGGNALEDAMAALLKGQQGGGQGGSWEIDPTTGEQVWVID